MLETIWRGTCIVVWNIHDGAGPFLMVAEMLSTSLLLWMLRTKERGRMAGSTCAQINKTFPSNQNPEETSKPFLAPYPYPPL
jgi:hypothetical protein